MAGSQKGTLSFDKLFCPETCSEKLEIPISFKKSVRILPRQVLLRNGLKKIWTMEIIETGDGLYFQNDWAEFVKDNLITNGDRLVFYYDGYGVFDFVIYDQSGREKIAVLDAQSKVIRELNEDDVIVVAGDVVDGSGDKDEEEVKADPKRKRNNAGGSKKGAGAGAGEGSSSKKNKDVHYHFGADLFASGQFKDPKNPYFFTKLGQYKRNALYVPGHVIKDHNLALPPTLTLRDPRGNEWKTEVRIWGDGRTWLKGPGWQSLCQRNLIEEGDQCMCEFVHPRTNDMFLQITVVPRQATKNNLGRRSNSV